MATGGSEETFDFTCTPCYKDGKHVEASVYCEECRECLCEGCYSFHQRFTAMVVHKVLDKATMQAGGAANMTSLPTDTCDTHAGKLIVVYCADHDALCCSDCVSSDHRSCTTVYIPETAIGFRDSTNLKDQADSTNSLADQLKNIKLEKETLLQELRQDRTKAVTEVQMVTNDLIQRIKDMQIAYVDVIKQGYDPIEATLEKDIRYLEGVTFDTQSVLNGLDTSVMSEAQLYVNEIRAQRHNTNLANTLTDNISQKDGVDKSFSSIKIYVTNSLDRLKELEGMVENAKVYSAKFMGNYNVKIPDDKKVCRIYGSCQLPDGTVVITDWNNQRLKRLDASYNLTDHFDMHGWPWGVTCTAPDEVAVTMTEQKKVQFVSVRGSLTLSRSFSTRDRCRGIVYSGGKLCVACDGLKTKGPYDGPAHVMFYSLEGVQLIKAQIDPIDLNTCSLPFQATANSDGDRIYVAQDEGKVIVLDKSGKIVATITNDSIKDAFGLCTLGNNHILVCGKQSHNVLQFDCDGRKVTELLNDHDSIVEPRSLFYDSINSRLIVTMKNTDIIKVFDLM